MNKSLFRRPGTKTFQLVHRSQRDPLINDAEASDRVFKEIDTTQGNKAKVCEFSARIDLSSFDGIGCEERRI